LHRRLTVALANAADRARVTEVVASDPGAIGVDGATPLLRSEDLWHAAVGLAQERAADRADLRARLDAASARALHDCDTARHKLDHLLGWRRTLLEGADWAAQLELDLPETLAAVETARDFLDEQRAAQRAAQQDLERVLEQRHAVAVAVDDADSELAELAGTGMDESGLRRELEAAGQAVQQARAANDQALARLEELQIEASGLQVRREEAAPAAAPPAGPDPAAILAVQEALAELQAVSIDGAVDPEALALAAAWEDLNADLAELGGPVEGPSADEIEDARRRLDLAVRKLAELDAAATASAITAEQRAALDVAHAAVLVAEEQISRRRSAASARKKLDEARAAERALLDQHGFGGYLDVVLTGGRAAAADPNRPVVEREHFEAALALEALERAGHASPDLQHLRSERARLLDHITRLLGVDPGPEVVALLRAHRPMSTALQAPLVEALDAVGVHPAGTSLEAAAVAFLTAHPLPDDTTAALPPANERHIELAAIEARSVALEGELDAAQTAVDRTAEALHMAERSVGAFESELTVRAGEDVQRLKRFAAAEQLRAQVASVAGALRRAEEEARAKVAAADREVASAAISFEQAAAEVSELARRVRKLAEELPIDQRPDGDPLAGLPALAQRLQLHSDVLQPEIDRAESALGAATTGLDEVLAARQLAGSAHDGPLTTDLVDGLELLLSAEPRDTLVLLDEPFIGLEQHAHSQLLEVVRAAAGGRQIVLLTEDPEALGWAIELPIEDATTVPADALLARVRRENTGLVTTVPDPASPTEVDITTTATIDPDTEPAPTARRWAGQR
jgi:hypothetical protein